MTKAAAGVITHEAYRRTSPLFWRHTTRCASHVYLRARDRGCATPRLGRHRTLRRTPRLSKWRPTDAHRPDHRIGHRPDGRHDRGMVATQRKQSAYNKYRAY